MYHYAGNNPVKYTDPDGRMLPAVAATAAYWASAFVVSVAVVYLATPAGQQGLQALGEAISYGAQSANQAVANAVTAVKTAVKEKQETKVYLTYTMTNDEGVVYSGRTSGYGTPDEVLKRRYKNHHMIAKGFHNAKIDQVAYGEQGRLAIRGREQQLIDKNGGAQLDIINGKNGTSGNRIRGVSKFNPLGAIYHEAANKAFGNIAPYTGFGSVQE